MQTYTLGFLQSADLMRPSGNEHSSAHRQLPVDAFVGFLSSDKSMLCVDMSDATIPLFPVVRRLYEALAETILTEADGARPHEASA